ncbi:MAG: sulfatase [Alphaproteobacteria bacterium]
MKAVFVLFDSLNRLALGAYGGDWIRTPNFDRFARRAVTFDKHYVGSLPCMPARRDMHTGRLNFMHRSWGPLEPFDNSLAQILHQARVHTHLISDHLHYFEDGGSTYHTRYTTWEFIRGQEYDPWKAMVQPPLDRYRAEYSPKHYDFQRNAKRLQHAVNVDFMRDESLFPGPQCFAHGIEFLERNWQVDNWFLQIECFDPHEPFHAPDRFKHQYRTGYNGGVLDWPLYEKVSDSREEVAEIRANYAALVAMCDHYFGLVLDFFDAHDLWSDTMLVLTTDHGFLLAEHDWWGKNLQPYYEEISHIPMIVHHPAHAAEAGRRVDALTQTIDLMPTFLETFGLPVPPEVRGVSLLPHLAGRESPREGVAFGMFGGPIGVTDGRWACYLYPEDLLAEGLGEYTLMPMHLSTLFSAAEMKTARLAPPFDFTKGMPLLRIDALKDARRIPIHDGARFQDTGTKLFDLEQDPEQLAPVDDPETAARLAATVARIFAAHDAPAEIYGRMKLPDPRRPDASA